MLSKILSAQVLCCVVGIVIAGSATAAPYFEVGDAGALPGSAQKVTGSGAVTSITGTLSSGLDVDMFAIFIDGGGTFSATTEGLTTVDTKLFLFNSAGRGVYANDDANVFTLQSALPAGDPLTPLAPGVYYLAIAGFGVDAVSASGQIFSTPFFPEDLLGPGGPGGADPVTGFVGTGDFGDYSIALTGASFVTAADPTPVPLPPAASLMVVMAGGGLALRSAGRLRAMFIARRNGGR